MSVAAKQKDSDRIWFAQMLRAIAVLAVLVSHYCDVFVHANPVVVGLAYTRPVSVDPNLLLPQFILSLYRWDFNAGPFGVGIFSSSADL